MQLRDLVHMFISRVELLPEDETTAEHDEAMRIEAQLIESDRMTSTDGEPGLFKGAFCQSGNRYAGPIRDEEDGVLRCPRCAWEMEDGECGQCGYEDGEGDFSDEEDHEGDTVDSGSVISIPSSAIDADDAAAPPPFVNPFLFAQSRTTNDDFREWMRRDQEARHARRAARRMERRARRERAHTADTEETTSTMMERHRHGAYDVASEHEEEMAGFLERHPYNDHWNPGTSEPGDEDEEMTSAVDDDDRESTTSFHRAAILARDQGLHPPFESDLSSNGSETGGEVETATNGNSSEDSTESDDDSDTPEPGPTFQRLASRPARVVIDSDDDSSSDSSSSGEEEDEDHGNHVEDDEEESDDSSEGDSTPSPPRPAAVRQARVQMHRNRNRGGRGGGRGRGRGRPRMRN